MRTALVKPLVSRATREQGGCMHDRPTTNASAPPAEEDLPGDTPGMRAMFWTWAVLIAAGLAVMIVIPWGGR